MTDISAAGTFRLGDRADHHLVLDDEDGRIAPELAGFLLGLGLGRRLAGLGAVDGEVDGEARALPHLGFGEDEAARLLDDAVDGGEAEPDSPYLATRIGALASLPGQPHRELSPPSNRVDLVTAAFNAEVLHLPAGTPVR